MSASLLSRLCAILLVAQSCALPATAAERRPTEFGVCFHHGAYGNEYTPAAAAVLDDLRAAGKFWIRGDYQDPAKDARFAADMVADLRRGDGCEQRRGGRGKWGNPKGRSKAAHRCSLL